MDGLKDRSTRILSSDRFNEGVSRVALSTGNGCAFDSIACVFKDYSPKKVLPRFFETEPVKYSEDLSLSPVELIEFVEKHKNELGFEVDVVYFAAGVIPFTDKDIGQNEVLIKKHKDKISFSSMDDRRPNDMFGLFSSIIRSHSPVAAIMRNANGGHLEPVVGDIRNRKKTINKMVAEGYDLYGYLTFKKIV